MSSYPPSILYIHGLNSSPLSQKASHLSSALERLGRKPSVCGFPPCITTRVRPLGNSRPVWPSRRPLLVGSSLGGYYATHLAERHGLKAC